MIINVKSNTPQLITYEGDERLGFGFTAAAIIARRLAKRYGKKIAKRIGKRVLQNRRRRRQRQQEA